MVIRKHVRRSGTPVGPILMLSYKNHALDELLCDVIQFDPSIRPGALVRCGKIEAPELSDYSERNTAEEREAEKKLQSCLEVHRNARDLSRLWWALVRARGQTDRVDAVLLALKLLMLLQDSANLAALHAPQSIGHVLSQLLGSESAETAAMFDQLGTAAFESAFGMWLGEARHWRELFHGEIPPAKIGRAHV